MLTSDLEKKSYALIHKLQQKQRILVAFSGGCDSTFLLAAARQALPKENVLAVTAISASLASAEKEECERLARQLGANHQYLETHEMEDSNYTSNPSNRCFFCKNELFSKLSPIAERHQMVIADGFNLSDESDYRPGRQAAEKWNVYHPLADAQLTKKDIRALSHAMGLPTWDKPASPCLSSRIPYGTSVTQERLAQIEKAEAFLHAEGFSIVRVRHYDSLARIEVPLTDICRLQEHTRWQRIETYFQQLGYHRAEIDERGFKSGRLNEIFR